MIRRRRGRLTLRAPPAFPQPFHCLFTAFPRPRHNASPRHDVSAAPPQEMIFACALYPRDALFLASVDREVREQVARVFADIFSVELQKLADAEALGHLSSLMAVGEQQQTTAVL